MLFVFIAIIGLINFYLYRVAAAAYPQWAPAVGVLLAFLVMSLFAAIYCEKKGMLRASVFFSWIGYTWLGVSGMALVIAGAADLVQIFLPGLDDRRAFHAVVGTVGLATVYGFVSARSLRVKRVCIASRKLGDRLRIVQISDLHLGDSSTFGRTRRVVEAVNRLKPDIVVSTGDLFDGFLPMMGPFVEILQKIEAPLGTFAISGNHEVYAGLEAAMELTRRAGFKVLRDESIEVGNALRVIGVEDPASPRRKPEATVFENLDTDRFNLLLKHRPSVDRPSVGRFDLQLSGHTHGGQIFPFHYLTKLQYKSGPGLSRIAENCHLYVSRGTGSWGPQLRVFAPPEITCLEIGYGDGDR